MDMAAKLEKKLVWMEKTNIGWYHDSNTNV